MEKAILLCGIASISGVTVFNLVSIFFFFFLGGGGGVGCPIDSANPSLTGKILDPPLVINVENPEILRLTA